MTMDDFRRAFAACAQNARATRDRIEREVLADYFSPVGERVEVYGPPWDRGRIVARPLIRMHEERGGTR